MGFFILRMLFLGLIIGLLVYGIFFRKKTKEEPESSDEDSWKDF